MKVKNNKEKGLKKNKNDKDMNSKVDHFIILK